MKTSEKTKKALEKLVKDLADGMKWNWTRMASHRDAADAVLSTMAELGLIREKNIRLADKSGSSTANSTAALMTSRTSHSDARPRSITTALIPTIITSEARSFARDQPAN